MSLINFGTELLRTGDLDPVYVALYKAKVPRPELLRVCVAYWCFYHLGVAAYIAECGTSPKKFWALMTSAAINDGLKYPRGSERRHYRGAQAVTSMTSLSSLYPQGAESAFAGMVGLKYGGECAELSFSHVKEHVQRHRGFGDWIAFKIADMSERVLGVDVNFDDCHLGIYKDPRQGAAVAYTEWKSPILLSSPEIPPWDFPIPDHLLKDTVAHYVTVFKKFKAPPAGDRPVNVQEVETIFCKYKSHLKGHYPMGKDTREIKHALEGWGSLAAQLKEQL